MCSYLSLQAMEHTRSRPVRQLEYLPVHPQPPCQERHDDEIDIGWYFPSVERISSGLQQLDKLSNNLLQFSPRLSRIPRVFGENDCCRTGSGDLMSKKLMRGSIGIRGGGMVVPCLVSTSLRGKYRRCTHNGDSAETVQRFIICNGMALTTMCPYPAIVIVSCCQTCQTPDK